MNGIKLLVMDVFHTLTSATTVASKEDVDKIIEDSGTDVKASIEKVASTIVTVLNPIALVALLGIIILKVLGVLDMKKFLLLFGGTLILLIIANIINNVL